MERSNNEGAETMTNTTSDGYTTTTTHNTDTRKATRSNFDGTRWDVTFGRIDSYDGEFMVSHLRTSRTYKTRKGADKAIRNWTR